MLDLWWVLISDRTFLGPVSSNEPLFRICQSKLNIHQSEWGWYSGPTVKSRQNLIISLLLQICASAPPQGWSLDVQPAGCVVRPLGAAAPECHCSRQT